jgi:anti-sigma factor RsiW
MTCSKKNERLLHALMDGELDALNASDFEAHLAGCRICAAEYELQKRMRLAIRSYATVEKPSADLRLKIEAMVDEAAPSRQARPEGRLVARSNWWISGAALAMAASLALFAFLPSGSESLQEQLVASHVRSLLESHLTDIQTSDRHTVRPWLNGKVDVAPPAIDLAKESFPLLGARLDYIDNRVVATLVYKRTDHIINVFTRPVSAGGDDIPRDSVYRGYNLRQWRWNGIEYLAITDASRSELKEFADAYARALAAL